MSTPPPIPEGSKSLSWFYADVEGKPHGPISSEELKRLVAAGTIRPGTPVTPEGQNVWKPFSEVRDLSSPMLDNSKSDSPAPLPSYTPPPLPPEFQTLDAKGDGGTIQLFPDRIRITRPHGIGAFLKHGIQKDRDVFISQILSVQFKSAGWGYGYIALVCSNCSSAMKAMFQAAKDGTIVNFTRAEQDSFLAVKAEIEKRLATLRKAASPAGTISQTHPPITAAPASPTFPITTPAETPLMEAEGDGGNLQLFDEKVCIRRKPGFASFITYGAKGDKDIYISQISSVQFKAAGLLAGYIQFTFAGGMEAKHGYHEAFSDENTVMFRSEQQWNFQRIKEEIDKRIAARTTGHSQPNPPSYLDELEKLATLRDKGIITPEEFEAKKRNLLGI